MCWHTLLHHTAQQRKAKDSNGQGLSAVPGERLQNHLSFSFAVFSPIAGEDSLPFSGERLTPRLAITVTIKVILLLQLSQDSQKSQVKKVKMRDKDQVNMRFLANVQDFKSGRLHMETTCV